MTLRWPFCIALVSLGGAAAAEPYSLAGVANDAMLLVPHSGVKSIEPNVIEVSFVTVETSSTLEPVVVEQPPHQINCSTLEWRVPNVGGQPSPWMPAGSMPFDLPVLEEGCRLKDASRHIEAADSAALAAGHRLVVYGERDPSMPDGVAARWTSAAKSAGVGMLYDPSTRPAARMSYAIGYVDPGRFDLIERDSIRTVTPTTRRLIVLTVDRMDQYSGPAAGKLRTGRALAEVSCTARTWRTLGSTTVFEDLGPATSLLAPLKHRSDSVAAPIKDRSPAAGVWAHLCSPKEHPVVAVESSLDEVWSAYALMFEGKQPVLGIDSLGDWVEAFAEIGLAPYDPEAEDNRVLHRWIGVTVIGALAGALLWFVGVRSSSGSEADDDIEEDSDEEWIGRAGAT